MISFERGFVVDLIFQLVPMILSLSVHEYAHAVVAYKLGDDTAARAGRLTLSPLSHIDLIGTILVPAASMYFAGFSFIGWAKPVPIRPERFTRKFTMKTGMILTSIAGPLSNLSLAVLSIATFALLQRLGVGMYSETGRATALSVLLRAMFGMNVGLCIFNLIPIPPLDGSRLLPRSLDGLVDKVAPYSVLFLLLILNIGVLRQVLVVWPWVTVVKILQSIFGVYLM